MVTRMKYNPIRDKTKSARSYVLIVGNMGPSFEITRSLRQGCLLAPYLFILYTKSLSTSLQAVEPQSNGMQILRHDKELIISAFNDDTMSFVNGMHENNLINSFCRVLGAKINCHKSKGWLIGGKSKGCRYKNYSHQKLQKLQIFRYHCSICKIHHKTLTYWQSLLNMLSTSFVVFCCVFWFCLQSCQ